MTILRVTPQGSQPARAESVMSAWPDDELVNALRAGDDAAYEHLWLRHVGAAVRVARRWAPTQADDLVSEAFLTVYEQIRHRGAGPTEAFRGYLFAVIRNIAARWYREGSRLIQDPDVDLIVEDDALQELERADDRAMLLHAFQELPSRWQRILWLTDVENAARPMIAGELGIPPNAVSSLHRRARHGLRLRWLEQHIPTDLRGDPAHIADDLPRAILRGSLPLSARLTRHLATCSRCHAVERDLRASYRDGRKTAASIGSLAALGVVLPAASSWLVAPVTITIAAGIGPLGAAAVAAGVLALGLGATTLSLFPPQGADPAAAISADLAPLTSSAATTPPAATTSTAVPLDALPATQAVVGPSSRPTPAAEIPIRFSADGPFGFPDRPAPAAPAAAGTTVPPGSSPSSPAAPAVGSTAPSSAFLAPVFTGIVQPGTTVAVQVAGLAYEVLPDAKGAWTFDLRALQLPTGTHPGEVWTITEGVASQATTVTFTIEQITLDGFPDSYPSVTLRDGVGGGLPFTMRGAPNGSICIESDTGQSAVVPLDAAGSATRVLRFYNYGIYVLRISACDGPRFGPEVGRVVTVTEGLFDPYVLDDIRFWDVSEF
ncbi:sigma-70 family RNA polymerase sigma factor [Microbacterium sp. NPDC091662]|uniref:sigma-70 family RNA polymerase sigma factor n=1 Tax=Microbacterium sp. NPDC091662 TaxID=3364211 RepID=UPI00380AE142